MIKGLIITSNTGVCLFYKSYGCTFDSEILSNFLVANDIFSAQMIGESMGKIQMKEKTQFIFEKDRQFNLIFILITDIDDEIYSLQLKLIHIKYAFLLNFTDLCKEMTTSQNKYHKIPNKQKVESIIDPIILTRYPSGDILNFIKFFGIKKTANIFSTLLSKHNILIFGNDAPFIKKIILTIPLFLPFREFLITNRVVRVEKIGLLIPWMENFNLSQKPNCWWIVGTSSDSDNLTVHDSLTMLDVDNKKLINGLNASHYENYLIKSINTTQDPQLAHLFLANRMKDILNKTKLLINFNPTSENILNNLEIHPSILPTLNKIAEFDFNQKLELEDNYFTNRLKQIFGV